mgnify:CR=1 FL=1
MGDLPVSDFLGDTQAECICFWGHQPLNSGPDGETYFNARDAVEHAQGDTRRVVFRTRAVDSWVVLEVEDEGCGIPEDLQGRIFEPFFDQGAGQGHGTRVVHLAGHRRELRRHPRYRLSAGHRNLRRHPSADSR